MPDEGEPPLKGLVRISGDEILLLVGEFERYLVASGVLINPSSVLRQLLNDALNFKSVHGVGGLPPGHSYESYHANALSAVVWASAVLRARGTTFELDMKSRLRLLAKGDPAPVRAGKRSRERDLLFELICGCALARALPGVRFAEPPDIECELGGRRWGLACKVGYGSEQQTADALTEGIRQVERSEMDAGIVVLDMTNVFPHELMVPRLAGDPAHPASLGSAQEAVDLSVNLISARAESIRGNVHLRDDEVRKCQLAVFIGHTFCRILGVPTPIPFFLGLPFPDRGLEGEARLLTRNLYNGFGA